MSRIAAIIPYFGRLPGYLPLFFESFKKNDLIDLFLITDDDVVDSPDNVTVVPMEMSEYNQLATRKLGVPVDIKNGYKLCEFKPAYGIIFEDLITDYPFWACMDLDMIIGDVRNQLPRNWPELDILSVHTHWLSGPFSIFKNREDVNNLFKKSADWERVFTSQEFFSFCECGKAWSSVLENGQQHILESEFDSFSKVILTHRDTIKSHFGLYIKEKIRPKEWVSYTNGRIFDHKGMEFAFYHTVCEKNNYFFEFPGWRELPAEFYVDLFGFYIADDFKSWRGRAHRVKRFVKGGFPRFQDGAKRRWNSLFNPVAN